VSSKFKVALTSFFAASILTACGGGGGTSLTPTNSPSGTGTATQAPAAKPFTNLETREEAARFLIQAGFGGTDSEIDALVGTDAADWIAGRNAQSGIAGNI